MRAFPAFLRFVLLVATFLVLVAAILAALAVSREPSIAARPMPTPAELAAGQRALREINAVREAGEGTIRVDSAALEGLAAIASRATGVERLSFELQPDRVVAAASYDIGRGLWANLALAAVPAAEGEAPELEIAVGRLTMPGWATPLALKAARIVLKARGTEMPPLDGIVQTLAIGRGGLAANVDLPSETAALQALPTLRSGAVDPNLVRSAYCGLVERQREDPQASLAVQVRRAFADDRPEGAAANRAALVALAMVVVDTRVGLLAGLPRSRIADCGPAGRAVTLAGRQDLARHWALSAALVAALGAETAEAAGEWKELADSSAEGSGFSFVDLAADRGGLLAAQQALRPASAVSATQILASATEQTLLPGPLRSLPEGLSEAQFAARYGSTEDRRYQAVVRTIDAELNRRWTRAGR